ncbi:MAG: hypothetical protein V4819_18885 [Verrucomicrobiota bacterium]
MRYLICLLCLIPTLVTAQPKAARSCRVVFASAPADAPEKLFLFDGTSSQEVELPQMNLSPIYKLPAGPLVVSLLSAAPAKAKGISPDAPKVTIPEAVTDFYLIVTSDPSNTIAPVKLQMVDATPNGFPKGRMIWFNLTANTVNGKVGTEQLALASNSRVVLGLPTATGGDYPVNLTFRQPGNDVDHPLCETKWSHDGLPSTLFVLVMESGSRTPRVLAFTDLREAEKSKPKKPAKK